MQTVTFSETVALMTALKQTMILCLRSSRYGGECEPRDRLKSSASIEHVFFEKVDLGRKFRAVSMSTRKSLIRCGDFSCRIEVKWPEICCLQRAGSKARGYLDI